MTRQQEWSLRAHEQVLGFKNRDDREKKKLKTYGMKMPGLIQQSGLVQALVFVQTRPDSGPTFVNALAAVYGMANGNALVRGAQQAGLPDYLALSRDLIEVSAWVRRFVQIELKDVKEDDDAA